MVAAAVGIPCWDCGSDLVGAGLLLCEQCGSHAYVDRAPRCSYCGRLLMDFLARPWQATCPRCKTVNRSA